MDADKMKLKTKGIVLVLLVLALLACFAGCRKEQSPYEINNAENYNVSVKYDANGGFFTTNTSVIVDSYNISELEKNSDGMVELALLAPDDNARGQNAFTAINNGYFLAGWYTERVENGTDANGNAQYTYAGKWDFAKDKLEVSADETHTGEDPVVTLYAAWIPMFQIRFYDLDSGELMETMTYDPTADKELLIPSWDEKTGAVEMHSFPEKSGYTFESVYYDEKGTQAVQTAQLLHPGVVNYATGTATEPELDVYVKWTEGEWFHIYTVEQFLDNASVSGNYVIHEDLDFADETWPTALMHGSFAGTIQGNGHTFKNISFSQTNNSKTNSGLFGQLTETAKLSDITFENVTFTIEGGTRMAGTTYGLLAGSVSDQAAVSGVAITGSKLQIDSGCYFGTDDYTIGLVCGMGAIDVDYSGITCQAVGDAPETVVITVNESTVTVEFK